MGAHGHTHAHADTHTHADADAHGAGDGAAVLDIGDDIGAILAVVPDAFAHTEIDITRGMQDTRPASSHDVHTGVHPRWHGGRTRQVALYPALPAGVYQLWHPHHDRILATVDVVGGEVCEITVV